MKKVVIIFLFFLILFFSFNIKKTIADHNCFESCGNPSYCNSGLSCIGGICKNANCPNIPDCTCPTYKIQGYKVKMPGNLNVTPFSQQTVSIAGGSSSTTNPYTFQDLSGNKTVSVNVPPGSNVGYTLCFNKTDCHSSTPTSGSSVNILSSQVITGNVDQNNYYYADLWWHYTPLIANCSIIEGPSQILIGDSVEYTVTFSNYNSNFSSGAFYSYSSSCPGNSIGSTTNLGDNKFNWTPTSAGNYNLYCKTTSSDGAVCIGYSTCVVNPPPEYLCDGPNSSKPVVVQDPQPWYKLKDTSLNKIGNHNIAVVSNPQPFDDDDNTNRYVIINSSSSNPGLLLATENYNPGPSYNPIPSSINDWHVDSLGSINTAMIDNFYQYIISRKEKIEINNINQISNNGIYTIQADNLTFSSQPPAYNFVLVIRNSNNNDYGEVTINTDNFNSNLKSIAILAKNITFDSTVNLANGIFIAQNQISYESTNGLKINGNLISKNTISLQSRLDNSKPSLFIVFNKQFYIDLLPYLSVAKYEWRQLK